MGKILPGHENLQPRDVVGIDGSGRLLVDYGDEGVRRYALKLNASGGLSAVPFTEPSGEGPDQIGPPRKSPSLAERLKGIDQA